MSIMPPALLVSRLNASCDYVSSWHLLWSPDQHLGQLDEVGVTEAAPAPASALGVIVRAAVPMLTTLWVTLTWEVRVISWATLARAAPVTWRNKTCHKDNDNDDDDDVLTSTAPTLGVIVGAAVSMLTTLWVALTWEARDITWAALARTGGGALEKIVNI